MVTKTLTITKDAYERLKMLKRPDESFSKVIKRITEDKQDIMRFAGILSDLSEKDFEEMKQSIRELRKRGVSRLRDL
ncbi:antitoxin VapB family protein [Candidatus Woesearchaeota archaeon]|nr:antitoxin VapB family protein [Candidatus Woesearchaeota archaeon]